VPVRRGSTDAKSRGDDARSIDACRTRDENGGERIPQSGSAAPYVERSPSRLDGPIGIKYAVIPRRRGLLRRHRACAVSDESTTSELSIR
jgi:hypothetical protein